jgi:hypothetical protein
MAKLVSSFGTNNKYIKETERCVDLPGGPFRYISQEPDIIDNHIEWLKKELIHKWQKRIRMERIQILFNILQKMDEIKEEKEKRLREFKKKSKSHSKSRSKSKSKHSVVSDIPDSIGYKENEQLFSYFFSSKWEDLYKTYGILVRDPQSKSRPKHFSIGWFIVKQIINSQLFKFEHDKKTKKIFFDTIIDKKRNLLKQKVYFTVHLSNAREIEPASAAADVPENPSRYPWQADIFIARRIITKQQGNYYYPLSSEKSMVFGGGWIGQMNGEAKWQGNEKIVFGVDVHKFIDSLPQSFGIYKERRIEMENILTVMLLLEHELIHIALGVYRPKKNYEEWYNAVLAKPCSFPRFESKKEWAKSSDSRVTTEQAFTDKSGHGHFFSEYSNLVFGFPTQLSPLDYLTTSKFVGTKLKLKLIIKKRNPDTATTSKNTSKNTRKRKITSMSNSKITSMSNSKITSMSNSKKLKTSSNTGNTTGGKRKKKRTRKKKRK